ncbi:MULTISPECIES: N-succinylarginine dihydrolase [Pseudoalteromonas]|uniref:N-succinylarginine dihydrolase n=1 Tax=Pseudoalteromonas amylolytica TaxID=1859457 RepID=A0A1S1MZG3_9GAMM|nr:MULTISPECIES: N-succinylarginine dihydrolase [Pseudoalteromonas]OHU88124.1 N-succinylarginine dihydrolase [Pseudoalteromonas sp. JW3]OHU91564.1 N-succinylarginine dihydrolase [Pseudoalteromonas amylolytica]
MNNNEPSVEVNFDGLVGPTHNYAGLSYGNVASLNNADAISNPKQAALQGLAKMKAMHDMGLKQGIFAPHARPDIDALRRLGFSGNDKQVLNKAAKESPILLRSVYSASSMWTANAATVSPSKDTVDGKVHFTSANLNNKFHRSLEPTTTTNLLKAMFTSNAFFTHHSHLPEQPFFGDEGAANHTRLCDNHSDKGLEVFVYGASSLNNSVKGPVKYPARQTLEASEAIARLHGIKDSHALFIQQNPDVIDQGVFHNDVIAVGNENVLLCHEQAFINQVQSIKQIKHAYLGEKPLHIIEVPTNEVSVQDAVGSYLFNSQLVTLPDGSMMLVAPEECKNNTSVSRYIERMLSESNPVNTVKFFDLRQSMQNGGGPACLRLRVALTQDELNAVNPQVIMSDEKFAALITWVDRHYRDRLSDADLADPQLLQESHAALDELTKILALGSVYQFQR